MSKRTPGQWRATGRTGPVMQGYSQPYGVAGTGDEIAQLICGCFGDTRGGEDAAKANAQLIAAAPALLDALKAIVRSAELNQAAINTFLLMDAHEAIARATEDFS